MVLDVTIKDQDGQEIFSRQNEYSVGDLHFKEDKQVPMAEWDITAMEHFGLGLEPVEPEVHTYIIPVKPGTKSVEVEALLTYSYMREEIFTMQKVVQKVVMDDSPQK